MPLSTKSRTSLFQLIIGKKKRECQHIKCEDNSIFCNARGKTPYSGDNSSGAFYRRGKVAFVVTRGIMNTVTQQLKVRSDLHIARKAWHITSGLAGLGAYYLLGYGPQLTSYALFGLAIASFVFELSRMKFETLNTQVVKVLGPIMRESERNSFTGLPFYALGVASSLLFFPEKMAILSVLFLIFADPIASTAGILHGRKQIVKGKSLEGFMASFLVCTLITYIYFLKSTSSPIYLGLFSLFAGLIGALSELSSSYVDDNLTIPLLSGAGLTFLAMIIPLN